MSCILGIERQHGRCFLPDDLKQRRADYYLQKGEITDEHLNCVQTEGINASRSVQPLSANSLSGKGD